MKALSNASTYKLGRELSNKYDGMNPAELFDHDTGQFDDAVEMIVYALMDSPSHDDLVAAADGIFSDEPATWRKAIRSVERTLGEEHDDSLTADQRMQCQEILMECDPETSPADLEDALMSHLTLTHAQAARYVREHT